MPATLLYPSPYRFGLPHPDTLEPEGFTFIRENNDFLRLREIATGDIYTAHFTNGDRPNEICRLIRNRMPTDEEITRHPQHVRPGFPVNDFSDTIELESPASASDRPMVILGNAPSQPGRSDDESQGVASTKT